MTADPIADLRSPTGSLVSVYLDRPSPGGMAALLTDLLRPVREEAEARSRPVRMSVKADAERIHALADELETDSAPAYAIFASDVDGLFKLEPLTHQVPNVAHLGPRPYLRPLRAAPRPVRAGVIIADRARARTFVTGNGLVEELGRPLEEELGKSNFGGFSGYAEHGVRARSEELSTRLWREASARLVERHLDRPFDYMVIGSHEETVEEIARELHPYLARLYRAEFVASPQTVTETALRAEIADLDQGFRHDRQQALAGRICDTAWSDGLALLGLTETLDACNAQAVDTLAVAGPFTRPGVICNQCGFLARTGEVCPVCSAALFPVADVVAAAMDATVAAGGKTVQLEVASPLDAEGVGALLRFPVRVSG